MPRGSVLVTPRPVSGDDVVAAARAVWARVSEGEADAQPLSFRSLDDAAVLQALGGDDLLVSVLRPRPLRGLDEVRRLRPGIDVSAPSRWSQAFWTEAHTPWGPAGAVGVAILDAVAAALDGVADHDGLTVRPGRSGDGAPTA